MTFDHDIYILKESSLTKYENNLKKLLEVTPYEENKEASVVDFFMN